MVYNNCTALGLVWCTVDYFLLVLSFLIFILTVTSIKIVQYISIYLETRSFIYSRDLVFICQSVQTLSMSVHYTFIGSEFDIIFLLQEYFLSVQYSIVFYYFLHQLSENMQLIKLVKMPLIILNILMLSGFLIYLGVYIELDIELYNCNNAIYVYLHGCGMALGVIFVMLGAYASKTLEKLKDSENFVVDKKKLNHFW